MTTRLARRTQAPADEETMPETEKQFTAQCCQSEFNVRPRASGTFLPIQLAACPGQQAPSPRAHLLVTLRGAEPIRPNTPHPPAGGLWPRERKECDGHSLLGHRRAASRTSLKPAPVTPNPALPRQRGQPPGSHRPLGGWGLPCLPLWPPGFHWSQPVSPPEGGVTLTSLGDLKPAGSSSAADPAERSTHGNWG